MMIEILEDHGHNDIEVCITSISSDLNAIINVKNKKIIIKLPDDFNSDKAEVIIQNVL